MHLAMVAALGALVVPISARDRLPLHRQVVRPVNWAKTVKEENARGDEKLTDFLILIIFNTTSSRLKTTFLLLVEAKGALLSPQNAFLVSIIIAW
jgi:hypothetical protein